MLFHTWLFLLFFAIVYTGYLYFKKTKFCIYWLLAASYVFYGWWNPLYLFLIVYSTTLDYCVVTAMLKSKNKKKWLFVSVLNNLFLLGFFKYAGFVTDNLNVLLNFANIPFTLPIPNILLPVGISFFTFQSMSYTIDYYRGEVQREPNLIRYAAFVSFFPQLVAGPIERARNLLPQLLSERKITKENITDGVSLFLTGFFKKVALADFFALYVDKIYSSPLMFDSPTLLIATFLFGWQIYFDFSGYTDMARGIAKIMGFELMLNFNNPFVATSLGDFWNRWHISLSTWFKEYVYIPFGGNRNGKFNTYKNMFLTMLISGLWHGAKWTFVIWGILHGVGRVLTRELERTKFYAEKVPKIIKQFLVFSFVTFTWIFFRAENFSDASLIIKKIFNFRIADPQIPAIALFFCVLIWLYQFIFESNYKKLLESAPVRVCLMFLMIFYLIFTRGSSNESFIYFQF